MESHTLRQNPEDQSRARELSLVCDKTRPPLVPDGYDVHRCLGEGAYGEVWQATERNTGCQVAIKFYTRRRDMDWSHLAREVEKLAFLSNDRHVVQLKGVGWDSEPPWYAMEYLEHGSLEDRLKTGPIEVEEAVVLFRDIAVGLAHSHGKGVLHCDLKPANVLLDQDARPRLCDFGQARLSNELTPALGTLFYMAPEQADLKAAPDVRWDVYALGALLYCMLTGWPPYRGDDVVESMQQGASLEERLALYREYLQRAPRPSEHRLTPGVDKRLADIIDRCLASNPSRRYPNVQAVLNDLDARARWRSQRPLFFLATVGPVLLLMVAALTYGFNFVTAIEEQKAVLRNKSLEGNSFAASFVAPAVGDEVARRWEVLEQAAADPQCQELLLAYRGAREAGNPEEMVRVQSALESWLRNKRIHYENPRRPEELKRFKSASWFITDHEGTQLSRHPGGSSVDRNYAHRDYFHGLGTDFPAGTPGLKPIRQPHLSIMFVSTATEAPMVAFSVPVFADHLAVPTSDSDDRQSAEREEEFGLGDPIGLLAMTVELGEFTEVQRRQGQMIALFDTKPDAKVDACVVSSFWPGASAELVRKELGEPIAAALRDVPHLAVEIRAENEQVEVEARIDWEVRRAQDSEFDKQEQRYATWRAATEALQSVRDKLPADASPPQMLGRRGALLEHPALADLKHDEERSNGSRPETSLFYYASEEQTQMLRAICEIAPLDPTPAEWREYRDPFGESTHPDYGGNWLAAIMPVVADYNGRLYPTGWAVVVQEQEQQVIRPVSNLSSQLRWQAVWGFLMLTLVLVFLWLFVMAMVRGLPRFALLQNLRRATGMTIDPSSSSRSPSHDSNDSGKG